MARTLAAFADDLAARHGDRPALIADDEVATFRTLAAKSRSAASGLAALGIGPGDRVALWLPNVAAWPILHLALARLGAITVAVNTRFRSAEVGDIVGRSGARALVLWPGFKGIDFLGILDGIEASALERVDRLILYGDEGRDVDVRGIATVRYRDLFVDRPAPATDPAAGDGALIFTTSGTTRAPKFVLHSHHSLTTHAACVAPAFGWADGKAVLLQALPLCGTFGHAQLMAALHGGCPSVLLPTFDGPAAAAAIRAHRVTHFNGSDEMFARLFEAAGDGDLESLTACGFAAFDPGLGDLVERGARHGVTLFGLYGMSEVQALFARQPADAPAEYRRLAGGRPTAADAAVRAREPETGQILADGESGELELRGPSLMAGYFGDAAATAAAMTDDGYFRTGDLGYTTGDGGFVFEARMGDVIRLGGFLVAPAEIEAHIETEPSVSACQVVGIDTPDGPRCAAFVVPAGDGPIDAEALAAHCAGGLAKFKVPAAFFPLDAFPTTASPNGVKIQRAKLRAMAQERIDGPAATEGQYKKPRLGRG